MRLSSTNEEIQFTKSRIKNLMEDPLGQTVKPPEPIRVEVERRETKDGQIIIKFSDGTYAYE